MAVILMKTSSGVAVIAVTTQRAKIASPLPDSTPQSSQSRRKAFCTPVIEVPAVTTARAWGAAAHQAERGTGSGLDSSPLPTVVQIARAA